MKSFEEWHYSHYGEVHEENVPFEKVKKWILDCKVNSKSFNGKPKVTLSIRIDEEEKEALKTSAMERGLTLSSLCMKLLCKENIFLLDKEAKEVGSRDE